MPREQEVVYLSGKIAWGRGLFVPSQFNKYSCRLYLDQESLNIVLDLKKRGIQNNVTKDENGYWVNLSRPSQINVRGALRTMDPPIVIASDGQPWDKNKGIGDDSDVTCQVIVRNWKAPMGGKTGVSIRLDSVRIDNLVEF